MSLILNIETATTVCSVSISKDDELLFIRELNEGFTHAENLHLFIVEALKSTSLGVKDLSAIAVSRGPGSYTGLRIGVSSAKGLAYALKIPLISIDTLEIMTWSAYDAVKKDAFYCPMIDARRMEVYTTVYNASIEQQEPIEALIIDETSIEKYRSFPTIYFFGDGMPKCREVLNGQKNSQFINNIIPSAKYMCEPAFKKLQNREFEHIGYFEPFYLKDFLAGKKKITK